LLRPEPRTDRAGGGGRRSLRCRAGPAGPSRSGASGSRCRSTGQVLVAVRAVGGP
jgi:hypothetical protein